jgi:hypothetical protein
MKLGALTVLGVLALVSPAQAQTKIAIDCDSVDVTFQTSIQPDSATVEITSDAGTETHNPTLAQGGSTVSFPLDGQNGELVQVEVTLVHAGVPNVTSASETLEECDEETPSDLSPLPSPSPTAVVETPSPASTVEEVGIQPSVPTAPVVEPSPIEEEILGTSTSKVEKSDLPAELAYTGSALPWAVALMVLLIVAGLGFRIRARGRAADALMDEMIRRMTESEKGSDKE